MNTRFEVDGLESDPLGLWRSIPAAARSFGTGDLDTAGDSGVRWRVVSTSPDEARRAAALQLRYVDATTVAVAEGARQFERFYPGDPGVSFAAAEQPPPSTAERRLLESIAYLRQEEIATSFGIVDRLLPDDWENTIASFHTLAADLNRLLQPTLLTETIIDGKLVAATHVGFSGDPATVIAATGGAAAAAHASSVAASTGTRRVLLQLLAQASGGAAILAGRFAIPGGALAALPAAYRYLQDLVRGAQQLLAAAGELP